MTNSRFRSLSALLALVAGASLSGAAGCAIDKQEPDKGEVDTSSPPGKPGAGLDLGKADNPQRVVGFSFESAHPYTNNMARRYTLNFATALPSCVSTVKIHFSMLRTEAGYDYLNVVSGAGATVASYDGNKDGTWTTWVNLDASKRAYLDLYTDGSVVRDGFRIDQVEWDGHVTCPLPPVLNCGDDSIDTAAPAPVCGCPGFSHCSALSGITVTHMVGGGFTGQMTGKRVRGLDVLAVSSMPATGTTESALGTVDRDALRQLLAQMIAAGMLEGPGRAESSNWTDCFTISTDTKNVSYCAPSGSQTAKVQSFIDSFESLLSCSAGALTCGGALSCQPATGLCAEACICPEIYQPVCGEGGHTFGNSCKASCAAVALRHTGECGLAGDTCGTLAGLGCTDGFKCRYGSGVFTEPHPDASGACVDRNYCDVAADCNDLPHVAVPGSWACATNACSWRAGAPWQALAGFRFETSHPYANSVSTWKELYLPAGAAKMRLAPAGTFDLEQGYDLLEVWTWKNGVWTKIKTFTGGTAPTGSDVFPGQYHYLHFVSDSSITKYGFAVTAEYGN